MEGDAQEDQRGDDEGARPTRAASNQPHGREQRSARHLEVVDEACRGQGPGLGQEHRERVDVWCARWTQPDEVPVGHLALRHSPGGAEREAVIRRVVAVEAEREEKRDREGQVRPDENEHLSQR